jgi:hypothetical protein
LSYTRNNFQTQVLDFVIANRIPFNVVHHIQFQRMLQMAAGNNAIFIPSRMQIKDQLLSTADIQPQLHLADLPAGARISLGLDLWSSQTRLSFIGISSHFIDKDWKLVTIPLGFEPHNGSHSGVSVSEKVLAVLQKYAIQDRVMAITTDNAASNTTMADDIRDQLRQSGCTRKYHDRDLDHYLGDFPHVPCVAHVLNLVVLAMMKHLKLQAPKHVEISWDDKEILLKSPPGIGRTVEKVCISILNLLVFIMNSNNTTTLGAKISQIYSWKLSTPCLF